jgi:hypothetical protein
VGRGGLTITRVRLRPIIDEAAADGAIRIGHETESPSTAFSRPSSSHVAHDVVRSTISGSEYTARQRLQKSSSKAADPATNRSASSIAIVSRGE